MTVEELLNGAEVKIPPTHGTFKKAERVKKEDAKQAGIDAIGQPGQGGGCPGAVTAASWMLNPGGIRSGKQYFGY